MSFTQQDAKAQQEQVAAAPAPLFVPACPGAGKTHTIVRRHIIQPAASALRGGRALISFTRVAAGEPRARCLQENRPDLGLPVYGLR
ncbi:hypothetical protein TH66_19175 [Carbonactinospora thermoautotrophica]|uniref:UvrD/REP helicase n=1 Tax=Carbonactinospora thermoautotrophica TaxID=1469144 RepID=A0A132NF59_9ACTN|nr:UvrD-helicase domain-containing protein [Carbonactinospora thermoautotrophica]KWW97663.1 hypothetical protein TH66_19175 [Carbonactinospora thermoautotrophica]KWX00881.1 UvrD/REP helicase [Carbonactinospora thermoautotrophica]KWX08666.1 hypothetical protein TR74_13930 [Carbonactinospora thermoautotrophica]